MFLNIYVSALWSPLVNPACNTFPNSRIKYSFVPSVGGGVLLRHPLIIIKWTWGVFSPKFAIWPPSLYSYGQKSTKKRCRICSTKLTIKTSERQQCFSLFSCFQCFFMLLLILSRFQTYSYNLYCWFEQVNTRRVYSDLCICLNLFC